MKKPVHGRYHQPLTGAFLAFASMSFFACQDAVIKLLSSNYSLFQILFIRSGIIILPLFFILLYRYGTTAFITKKPVEHALRVLFNFVAFLSYYFAISRLPLSQATAIAMSAPLFMTALSGPLLGEHADLKRKVILGVGFCGVILIVQPSVENTDWIGTIAVLFGAFMFAMLGIQTRKISATESTELMVFLGAATFFCVTGMSLGLGWTNWVYPSIHDWTLLAGVGIISFFAQFLIVHSYQFAAVYIIAPFEYVTILWALILGWILFSEIPTGTMLAGSLIVVICGLIIVHFEHRQGPPGKIAH